MKSQKVLSEYRKQAENHGMLGKEIRLSPKAHVSLNKPGYGIDFFAPTVDMVIGIGKDHVAYLVMPEDAWKALNKGEEVNVTSLKEFKQQFITKPVAKKRKPIRAKK